MKDKRESFVRLAEGRVNRAVKDIRLIGNLSNRSAYSYTEDDIKKIFRVLQREAEKVVDLVISSFELELLRNEYL